MRGGSRLLLSAASFRDNCIHATVMAGMLDRKSKTHGGRNENKGVGDTYIYIRVGYV